jgi:excisionase family DNA binding protein
MEQTRSTLPPPRDGYTLREFAHRWQLSPRTIERAIARGEIRAVHIGRNVRIPASEAKRWRDGGRP